LQEVAIACALAIASATAFSAQTKDARPPRVLFIGNSLTAANGLPAVVQAMSVSVGQPLECERVAFGGFSLEDHWNQGDAKRAIARGGWSTVVLQQGPSALPESRVLLVEFTRRFDAEIKRIGARTALYMVWPTADRRFDFDGVKASYEAAANSVGGLFLPAGNALRRAMQLDRRLALFGADGFHPSAEGTYLAALVITKALTGRSIDQVPATLSIPGPPASPLAIPDADAAVLRRIAAESAR
jgi:hypothetical protein